MIWRSVTDTCVLGETWAARKRRNHDFLTIQIYDNGQSPEKDIISTGVDNKFIYSAQERATAFQNTVKTLLKYHPE